MMNARRLTKRICLFLAALPVLSACVFFEGSISRKMEKSPNFKAGYSDGCATTSGGTANFREQPDVRDQALFKTDKAYRAGWSAGYTACRPVNAVSTPQSGPIADPYPPR
jgi:hypothetical protein